MSKKESNNLNGWSISEELFQWITTNLEKNSIILELGSGYGTKELVKNYKVYSVEHDENWLNICPESNYIHAPLIDGWYDLEILKKQLPEKYEMLLVDGPIKKNRLNFTKNLNLFKTDVIIIFDDTNREGDKKMVEEISKKLNKEIIEFVGKEKNFSVLK